jgi:hypothetical protein
MKITGIIETMKKTKLSPIDYQIFLFKALFWVGAAWIGFAAALGGFFYAPLLWVLIFIFGIYLTYYFIFKCQYSIIFSREMLIISALSLFAIVLFSFFSTPTIFSGRDQGAISEAAVRLVQNHTFEFSTPVSTEFFKIYGPGRALNFPGFYYTSQGNLTTQFPLVYTVWLALFYSLFGITGFIIANAILLLIFLISFFLLIRLFLDFKYALPTFFFAITSFAFMWFLKFTLTENMALPLLWLLILALMLFLKSSRKLHYFIFIASAMLLFFTRIEGVAFLAVSVIIISLNKNARKFIMEKTVSRFFLPIIFFVIIFIANIFRDLSFYREIAKALLSPFMSPQVRYLDVLENSALPAFYIDKVFLIYGLFGFFAIGFISICFYIWKKELYKLIPFFIVLPTFIYFLDPHITSDHPWMLRRFMFSLLPAGIFYAGLLIGKGLENKKKKSIVIFSGIFAILLIAANLPAFLNYLTFSENKNLNNQVKLLADDFYSHDLILIDRETTTDGWSMISGPLSFLYGKNSAYFFNTNDLSKLDLGKFNNVYLIAPNKQVSYYLNSTIGNQLTLKSAYHFSFSKLNMQQNANKAILPEKKEFSANGKIFKIIK